ncbi:MAG TPA: phosphatidylglycerol lysyltransferase domain-containing protein [Candidatus Nanoarchaeia archaeon]|nr:phosphatidylglycerol lysyltransferase domain-containing protein [Candidatus Nanoarchaeia archaeon]
MVEHLKIDIVEKPERSAVVDLVKKFGSHCMAYSALQPGLKYHFSPGIGFIAYAEIGHLNPETEIKAQELRLRMKDDMEKKGINVTLEDRTTTHVLSDPVVDPANKDGLYALVDSFIAKHPQPCFWQTSPEFSYLLRKKHRFTMNHMGMETNLDLGEYEPPSKVKNPRNKALKSGITLKEANPDDFDWNQARDISQQWIQTKAVKQELGFLARSMVYQKEEDVRIFAAHDGKQMLGFVVYSPIYKNGIVTGYMEDILRARMGAPSGICDAINVEAIGAFKKEKKELLSLGLSPFYKIDDVEKHSADSHVALCPAFKDIFDKYYDIYNSPALAKHKEQYNGRQERIFFCTREEFPMEQILGGLRLSNVF